MLPFFCKCGENSDRLRCDIQFRHNSCTGEEALGGATLALEFEGK